MSTTAYPTYERPKWMKEALPMTAKVCEYADKLCEKGTEVLFRVAHRRKDRRWAMKLIIQVLANRMDCTSYCSDITVRQLARWAGIGLRRTHRALNDLIVNNYVERVTKASNGYERTVQIVVKRDLLLGLGIAQKHIHQTQSFKKNSVLKGNGYIKTVRQPTQETQDAMDELERGGGKTMTIDELFPKEKTARDKLSQTDVKKAKCPTEVATDSQDKRTEKTKSLLRSMIDKLNKKNASRGDQEVPTKLFS